SLDASLKRLGTDHVDLYWIHLWEFLTPIEEAMRALDDVGAGGEGALRRDLGRARLGRLAGEHARRPAPVDAFRRGADRVQPHPATGRSLARTVGEDA